MVRELNLENYLNQFKDISVSRLVPLIKYDQNWILPDKYKIEEYITEIKAYNKLIKIKRLRLIGRISKNCERPKTKKLYKGNLRRSGLKFVYKNRELWVVLKSNWPTSNKNLPLKCLVDGDYISFVVPKNFIGIWYKYGNNKINFIIISKKIKLSKEFWETFGILFGEMDRKGDCNRVSNTSPKVVNHILNYFDKSKLIRLDDWNITIDVNGKNIFCKKEKYEKKIKNYWYPLLKVNNLNIKNIRWCKYGSNLNPNFGQINLAYSNKTLNKVIFYLLDYIKKNVLNSKQNSMDFLRGIIAAEGSVNKDKNGFLKSVRIASKLEEERKFYKALFEKIGMKSKLYKNNHNIASSGLNNFLLCLKYDLFGLHEKRSYVFVQSLLNLLSIKASLLLLNKSLTINEIVKILNLKDYRNLNKNFSRLTKLNYLLRRSTNKCFEYSLSKEFRHLFQPLMQANGTTLTTLLPIPNS